MLFYFQSFEEENMEEKEDKEKSRLVRQAAIDRLFDVCIEKGLHGRCAQLADLGISSGKIDLLIDVYLYSGEDILKKTRILGACVDLAKKGASLQKVERIIAKCLNAGKLEYLPELLKIADRGLTVKEIESIHRHIPEWDEANKKFHAGMRDINDQLTHLNEKMVKLLGEEELENG
jgi:hypothetical protein